MARGNPNARDIHSWHRAPIRHKRIKSLTFWSRRPLGFLIRSIEILNFSVPLFSRLYTENSFRGVSQIALLRHFHGESNVRSLRVQKNYALRDVFVDAKYGFFRLNSGHLWAPYHLDRNFYSGNLLSELRKFSRQAITQKAHGIYFVLPLQMFFYHFLLEFLPKIISLSHSEKELTVISVKGQPKYVYEYLELAKIPVSHIENQYTSIQEVVLVDDSKPLSAKEYCEALRNAFLKKNSRQTTKFPKARLFITRVNQPRYDSLLEIELIKLLSQLDFRLVEIEGLSVTEQIDLFSTAEVVVGLHGGAFANAVYMPKKSRLIEIYTRASDLFEARVFEALSGELNHEYHTILYSGLMDLPEVLNRISKIVGLERKELNHSRE